MHPKAVTELCEKPPQWFALFLELSQETPVKRLLSLVCGTEQCDEFVEAMIEAVHLPVFASASAKVQLQVVQLLGMVPASTSLVRLLIVETAPAACQSVRYYCDRVAAKKVAILIDAGATELVEESFALCTAATGRFPPHFRGPGRGALPAGTPETAVRKVWGRFWSAPFASSGRWA